MSFTQPWRNRPYSYTLTGKEVAMRHILPIIAVAALLLATAVDVIAAGAKKGAARTYTAHVTGLSVALPSGMKSFPVELPQ
jgi:hypothetical protein